MIRIPVSGFVPALLLLAVPALASAAIVVDRPELRATLPGQGTAAAYMTVRNTGRAPDRLVGAACACAGDVQAHKTVTLNGVSTMAPERSIAVAPGKAVAFAPGGRHLMLMGLKAPIRAGASVPMVLIFQKAGRVRVSFKAVDAPGLTASPPGPAPTPPPKSPPKSR